MAPKILSLPSHVLAAVSHHGMIMTDSDIAYKGKPFEKLISHTCSHFRQLSLEMPMLWTSIIINKNTDLDTVLKLLVRSGRCGLFIRFKLPKEDSVMDADQLVAIVQKIVENSFRWLSLSIMYTQSCLSDPISMGLSSAYAPKLHTLNIIVDDVSASACSVNLINRSVQLPHILTGGAPKIEFIRLRGFGMHFFRPPLDTVVTLHLDQTRYLPIRYSTFRGIVTCSPFLENLSIFGTVFVVDSMPEGLDNTIHLPKLRALRLCSQDREVYSVILNILNAPNLKSLTLSSLHEEDLLPLSLLESADRQLWFSMLTSLTLLSCQLSTHAYLYISQIFRSIQTITISSRLNQHIDSLLRAMKTAPDTITAAMTWPKLTALKVTEDIWRINQLEIETMIYARMMYGHPIISRTISIFGLVQG